jgi:hypothetical protein
LREADMAFNMNREAVGGEYTVDFVRLNWTSRERLAAMAMQGFCSNPYYIDSGSFGTIPNDSFFIADAMLAYQDKEKVDEPAK